MTDCNTWTELHGKYYRRIDVFSMNWDDIDLQNIVVASAPYGGLLATTRNTKHLQSAGESQRPTITVYNQAGTKISQKLWEGHLLVGIGWTEQDNLMCIAEDGNIEIYSPFLGTPLGTFSVGQELHGDVLHEVQTWGNGFVAMTSNLQFICALDIISSSPQVYTLAQTGLTQLPSSWIVIPPDTTDQSPQVYFSTSDNLFVCDSFDCHSLEIPGFVPIVQMALSSEKRFISFCTVAGTISVLNSDLTRSFVEFQTSPATHKQYVAAASLPPDSPRPVLQPCDKLPLTLCWCGLDCVVAYYPTGCPNDVSSDTDSLLLVGPFDSSIIYQYDQPLVLLPELDGTRIITQTNSEFLQCVPKSTASIFAISSTEPGALLYEALDAFNNRSAKSYDLIRQIKEDLSRAVDDCIEAASNEFSHSAQRQLLKAASFGKSFLDFYTPEKFAEMCKTLRVLNAVREYEIGMPLTIAQYIKLSAEGLVMRLVTMKQFLLAIRICDYLEMYSLRNEVVTTWARKKVMLNIDDNTLCNTIASMLKDYPGVSFANIAEAAYLDAKKPQLALKLLELDTSPAQQAPLLLRMNQSQLALTKAMDSGDTDLVYMVLQKLLSKNIQLPDFINSVKSRPGTLELLLTYAKSSNIDLYRKICALADLPTLQASNTVRDIFYGNSRTLDDLLDAMQEVLKIYQSGRDTQFQAKMTEDFLSLLLLQRELTTQHNDTFLGISVNDTIVKLLVLEDFKSASNVANEFRVPAKTFWLLRLRAISTIPSGKTRVGLIAKLAKEKSKPPCGWEPFVKACVEANELDDADDYAQRISDLETRIDVYIKYDMWMYAFNAAKSNKEYLNELIHRAPPKYAEAGKKFLEEMY